MPIRFEPSTTGCKATSGQSSLALGFWGYAEKSEAFGKREVE